MKILLLDIERSPVIATVWGLYDQNIRIDQLLGDSEVLTWAAKWHGNGKMMDGSLLRDGKKRMLRRIHALLHEADAVATWNGDEFDLKVLQKEFLEQGFAPPAPVKSIDLLKVSRRCFYFTSHKLDYVAQALQSGRKLSHRGHQMWLDCMARKPQAFAAMLRYNRRDVALLERIYDQYRPWIKNHPSHGAHDDHAGCPNCGSARLQRRGVAVARNYRYARFQCRDCGAWSRGSKTLTTVPHRDRIAAIN